MKPYAIDFDDVLFCLCSKLNPRLNNLTGKSLGLHQWHQFNLLELYNIDRKAFYELIINEGILSLLEPLPGAIEAVKALNATGRETVIITSRGYHPNAANVTQDSLDKAGIVVNDLIIVPEGMSKAQAAVDRYPKGFFTMFDDHADNLDSMRAAGLVEHTVLIDKPWNQHRNEYRLNINRFESLDGYVEHERRMQSRRENVAAAYTAC